MNVLDNAAKWSPPGGHVGVTLEANSAWHLTVTDQGPGIAPEDLPTFSNVLSRSLPARCQAQAWPGNRPQCGDARGSNASTAPSLPARCQAQAWAWRSSAT